MTTDPTRPTRAEIAEQIRVVRAGQEHLDALLDAALQPAAPTPPAGQPAERRDRYAAAMAKRDGHPWPTEFEDDERDYRRRADAAMAVADAELEQLRAGWPLSLYYSHEACGFRWHGRDGMDIPMSDGQPVCPRCELEQLRAHAAAAGRVLTTTSDRLGDAEAEVKRLRADRAPVLTETERTMLVYALDQAQEHIWSRDGFTDDDQAAVTSLRRMADGAQQAEPEFTEARTAFMALGRTPSLQGLRTELRVEGRPAIVGRYCGAEMGRMHDVPGYEHVLSIRPQLLFEYAPEQQAADEEPGQ